MKRKWFIGIDISKRTLDVVIYDQENIKAKSHFKVDNDIKGFKKMMKLFKTEKVAFDSAFICLEYCGVYGLEIGFFLEKKISFCFCSPLHIKRSLGLTRGKNDKLDAFKIARFSYLFRDELSPSSMPTATMLKLKNLMGERHRAVKAATIDKQVLKELSGQLDRKAVLRSRKRLKVLAADISAIEKEVMTLIIENPELKKNYDLLITITGIAIVNATMMILCTNNFEGITNARSFACYCGVAPFEYTSGSSVRGKTKVSNLANKRMKANLTNAARSAIVHDPELRIYYKRKREEGKAYGTILNAIKFKLITRVYAVINRGTPFVKLRQAG
jgi:transposase